MNKYLGILLLTLPTLSYGGGWTEPLTVDTVLTEGATDLIVIQTSGGSQSVNGCVLNNWIFIADNENRRNRAYSTAMAALASGKKISLWYGDTCSTWSFHSATSIKLLK